MYLSILICVSVVILVYLNGALGLKSCHDCIPFNYCKNAKQLADVDKGENTQQMFKDAHCGIHKGMTGDIVKVCCSQFNVPDFHTRWAAEREHPNARLLPDSCGKIAQDRIIGGEEAKLYEFPWMVLIAYGDNNRTFGCAGTLINSRYVLTAAHCAINKVITGVRIGDFDWDQDVDCQGNICEKTFEDIQVENKIPHDDYDFTFNNDIALLRLKTPATIPLKNADIICLPTTTEIQKETIAGQSATVTGWGLSETGKISTVLRKVDIPVRSTSVCHSYYSQINNVDPKQLCAGKYKKDSCRGDSGGPLMMEVMIKGHLRYVQYGIVSNGPDRCGTRSPGIYTDIRKYMNWILDNLES